ncbi:putative ribonuclease H-like domain-containing protein, partial [Tanacetum coccineum]
IHKDHPKEQIIGDPLSAPQTRRMTKSAQKHAMVSYIKKHSRTNHKDYLNCLFAYFLSQIEPKKVTQALTDPSWIEAMQDELLQFRLQKVWRLVDLPKGKYAIGTKWVYRNKKDERGIVVRNKARLVAQEKALYGLHQAPRAWYETFSTYLLENGFRRGTIDKTLFIKKKKGDILLVHVYVDDIIFGSTKKSLCEEFEAENVDVLSYTKDFTSSCCEEDLIDTQKIVLEHSLDSEITLGGCHFLGKSLIHGHIIIHIEALFEGRLYGTICISAVDYTSWMLRMECKTCQVMKIDKKELAIPRQTATGKEFSNPLMAGSLPKNYKYNVSTARQT